MSSGEFGRKFELGQKNFVIEERQRKYIDIHNNMQKTEHVELTSLFSSFETSLVI